jgi:hypothetical protein
MLCERKNIAASIKVGCSGIRHDGADRLAACFWCVQSLNVQMRQACVIGLPDEQVRATQCEWSGPQSQPAADPGPWWASMPRADMACAWVLTCLVWCRAGH